MKYVIIINTAGTKKIKMESYKQNYLNYLEICYSKAQIGLNRIRSFEYPYKSTGIGILI